MSMIVKCDKEGIEKASKIISEGGVVVFPTDTVYGIGCDPYNKSSVEKIYQIKKRSKEKPLPILGYSLSTINEIVEFDEESKKIADAFWPGPLTLILKLKDEKLKEILRVDKIAVRVPDNQCLLDILKDSKFLIGTSANYSGENSFTNSKECWEKLKEYDIFVDGGNISSKGESTILEISRGKLVIHREGALKKEEITRVF
jgi:L-threonylcarbamoyladenylate synthase